MSDYESKESRAQRVGCFLIVFIIAGAFLAGMFAGYFLR